MISRTAILQAGAAALAQAAPSLSDRARLWVLGKAYTESGLGASGVTEVSRRFAQFDGTNNWGAVYWPSDKTPPNKFSTSWQAGRDSYLGTPTKTRIAVYPSQVDGAKGVLAVYEKYGDILPLLADSNTTLNDFVRALYRHGYFMGCHVGRDGAVSLNGGQFKSVADNLAATLASNPNAKMDCTDHPRIADMLMDTQREADEANIAAYSGMIQYGANMASAALAAPHVPQPVSPSPRPTESSGWWWKLPALAYGTYRLVKWERSK